MAGGIAQAYYEEVPKKIKDFAWEKLDKSMQVILDEFYNKWG